MKDDKKLAGVFGKIMAYVVVGCVTLCVIGLAIATTIKFYAWLF